MDESIAMELLGKTMPAQHAVLEKYEAPGHLVPSIIRDNFLMFVMQIIKGGFADREFSDLSVLDVGCGHRGGMEGFERLYGKVNVPREWWVEASEPVKRRFEPWLCRFAHELGCRTTGIDIEDNPPEGWDYVPRNVLAPHAFDQLPNAPFDLVVIKRLVSFDEIDNVSVGLRSHLDLGNEGWDYDGRQLLDRDEYREAFATVLRGVVPVVKEDGSVFIGATRILASDLSTISDFVLRAGSLR